MGVSWGPGRGADSALTAAALDGLGSAFLARTHPVAMPPALSPGLGACGWRGQQMPPAGPSCLGPEGIILCLQDEKAEGLINVSNYSLESGQDQKKK